MEPVGVYFCIDITQPVIREPDSITLHHIQDPLDVFLK